MCYGIVRVEECDGDNAWPWEHSSVGANEEIEQTFATTGKSEKKNYPGSEMGGICSSLFSGLGNGQISRQKFKRGKYP